MQARFLLFGPNAWAAGRVNQAASPRAHRAGLASILRNAGHAAELFEDLPDHPAGLTEKLERELSRGGWTHILVYLPASADTGSINSELTLVRARYARLRRKPQVWLWCQDRLVEEVAGELHCRDPPLKSAYLRDFLARVPTTVVNWDIHDELYSRLAVHAKALSAS